MAFFLSCEYCFHNHHKDSWINFYNTLNHLRVEVLPNRICHVFSPNFEMTLLQNGDWILCCCFWFSWQCDPGKNFLLFHYLYIHLNKRLYNRISSMKIWQLWNDINVNGDRQHFFLPTSEAITLIQSSTMGLFYSYILTFSTTGLFVFVILSRVHGA